MELPARIARIAVPLACLASALLVLPGIAGFGIWDPWELNAADIARRIADGEPPTETGALRVPPLGPYLLAQAFSIFGVHEWSGRGAIALCGVLTIFVAAALVARSAGARAGIYAAIITATTPLFLLNSRQMFGAAPAFLSASLVFLCAWGLVTSATAERPLRTPGAPSPGARKGGLPIEPVRIAWGVGLLASIVLSTLASGFLVGPLPALAAVAALQIARGELSASALARDRITFGITAALTAVVVLSALLIVRLIAADADEYSFWLGGAPRGGAPPSFEVVIEQVFHAFAPWSALLPLALAWPLSDAAEQSEAPPEGVPAEEEKRSPSDLASSDERGLRLALVLWAILGFCAQTIYLSRFGTTTFIPVVALAGAVALYVRALERDGRPSWTTAVVVVLLSALLLRDYRQYPSSPAGGLALTDFSVPEMFNPWRLWAVLFGFFALLAFMGLSVGRTEPVKLLEGDLRSGLQQVLLIDLVRRKWNEGPGMRAWILAIGTLVGACTIYGVMALVIRDSREQMVGSLQVLATGSLALAGASFVAASMVWVLVQRRLIAAGAARARFALLLLGVLGVAVGVSAGVLGSPGVSSLAVRIGYALTFTAPAIVIANLVWRLARLVFALTHRLPGAGSLVPMFIAALAFGAFVSFWFQREVSAHFSPREVYDAYNELASGNEPLGEYHVGGRAGAYYAQGEIRELRTQEDVLAFLSSPTRVWLAFRADDLAQLNRAYRQRAQRHLFIADARSARVLLATNQPIAGRDNQNYLAEFVLDAPPARVEHPVGASFDRRIELIGYDLDLPNGTTVGPGQSFTVTWYWRCLAPVPGSYQIFLHIDGMGQRLNGDHEPVTGRYPVRLWEEGDIVVDQQTLNVPVNYPPGSYVFFIGFYQGESRLDVVSGPADEVDRVRAGTLFVR